MNTPREHSEALAALIEGALAPEAANAMRARLLADPALRAEYDALHEADAALRALAEAAPAPEIDLLDGVRARVAAAKADEAAALAGLEADLEALGEADIAAAPEIDLVAGVRARVRASKPQGNIAPFPSRRAAPAPSRPGREPGMSPYALLAAAVCVVLGGLLLARMAMQPEDAVGGRVRVANDRIGRLPKPAAPARAPRDLFRPTGAPQLGGGPAPAPERGGTDAPPGRGARTAGISVDEAIRARRDSLARDAASLTRLAALAGLTEDEARAVVAQEGLTAEALLGATQYLPDGQARMIIEALIEKNPQDPYLRMALAMRSEPAQAAAQAQQWSNLDPANAMPHYIEAQADFAQGDAAGGLAALEAAEGLGVGNLYSLDTARQREQALAASGMAPDTARVLAAGTAGMGEADLVRNLGTSLIEQGRASEAAGDYAAAESLYRSAQQLGLAADQGATMMQERMAGQETQTQAIMALQDLYEVLNDPASLDILGNQASNLLEGIGRLDEQLGDLGAVFNENVSNVVNLAGFILMNGDLLLDFLD